MQYIDVERLAAMRAKERDRLLPGPEIPTLEWKKQNSWQAPEVPDNALQDGQVADRAVEALRKLKDKNFFLRRRFSEASPALHGSEEVLRPLRPRRAAGPQGRAPAGRLARHGVHALAGASRLHGHPARGSAAARQGPRADPRVLRCNIVHGRPSRRVWTNSTASACRSARPS